MVRVHRIVPVGAVLFLFLASMDAQVLIPTWVARFDGNNRDDRARDLGLDAAGNVFVTGQSTDGEHFDYLTVFVNFENMLSIAMIWL